MIFERAKYKSFAVTQLTNRRVVPLLITLIFILIMQLFEIPTLINLLNSGYTIGDLRDYTNIQDYLQVFLDASNRSLTLTIIRSLVEGILTVAGFSVYINMSRSPEPVPFSCFIQGLNNWFRAVCATLWMLLCTTLWTFLFIIPGIIKSIAYSQTYYLITEYKNLSVTKALKISMLITKGYKGDLFVMYLSFIGWDILEALSLGIASLWIEPYKSMTYINAYHGLLKNALETGLIKPEDLI